MLIISDLHQSTSLQRVSLTKKRQHFQKGSTTITAPPFDLKTCNNFKIIAKRVRLLDKHFCKEVEFLVTPQIEQTSNKSKSHASYMRLSKYTLYNRVNIYWPLRFKLD